LNTRRANGRHLEVPVDPTKEGRIAMAQETWLVVAVGAGFLLLGIAASPLAWVALLHRRTWAAREIERRFEELIAQFRALGTRADRCESALRALRDDGAAADMVVSPGSRPSPPLGHFARRNAGRPAGAAVEGFDEPRLIAVPKLPAAQDRQGMQNGLSQRYAAIWDLADSGASPDAIARATGQPIGQIELILGLRRQIDVSRTSIPHASHE
jgi:hypothetical protein